MKKSIVFVVVWGIILIVSVLAIASIYLMGGQAFVANKKVNRIRAYYTAKAGMVLALDELRRGTAPNKIPTKLILNSLQAKITVPNVLEGLGTFAGLRRITVDVDY